MYGFVWLVWCSYCLLSLTLSVPCKGKYFLRFFYELFSHKLPIMNSKNTLLLKFQFKIIPLWQTLSLWAILGHFSHKLSPKIVFCSLNSTLYYQNRFYRPQKCGNTVVFDLFKPFWEQKRQFLDILGHFSHKLP